MGLQFCKIPATSPHYTVPSGHCNFAKLRLITFSLEMAESTDLQFGLATACNLDQLSHSVASVMFQQKEHIQHYI